MTPEDLGNMIGYLQMYITEIQRHVPVLLNPDATAENLKESHTIIDSDLNSMYQLLNTACNMKQVQVDNTQLSSDDLSKMNLLNNTSGIDVVAQAVDASKAAASSPDQPIVEPMQSVTKTKSLSDNISVKDSTSKSTTTSKSAKLV